MTDQELQAELQEKYPRWQWRVDTSPLSGGRFMYATLQVYSANQIPASDDEAARAEIDILAKQIDMTIVETLRPYIDDPTHRWESDRVRHD